MNPRNNQLLPVIIIVVVVVVSVAAIVALARTLLFGGGDSGEQTEQPQQNALIQTSSDRSVRMTIRGPITADEKFRSYQITISPSSRVMTTYAGYLDQQIDTVQLENNSRAYEEFVFALDRAGMMEGTPLEGEQNDRRGLCPTGKILEFETLQNSNPTEALWTTTCGGVRGSFKGNSAQISDMFLGQIPQGPELLKKINEQ
jgi:hypothetical protein